MFKNVQFVENPLLHLTFILQSIILLEWFIFWLMYLYGAFYEQNQLLLFNKKKKKIYVCLIKNK